MTELPELQRMLAGHPLVRGLDRLPTGPVRIETAFLYPDGASIDLFIAEGPAQSAERRLTDLGQTMSWLLDVQVKPWLSRKRQGYLEDALRLYKVEQRGGELTRPLSQDSDLLPGIVSLGQACVRVSDLMFTKRSAMVTAFTEQVEEVLNDVDVPYAPNVELQGRFGNLVRVDFVTTGPGVQSAILTLSSGNPSQAHVAATEVFRRWYDLQIPARHEQRVTVLDDRTDVYREEDIRRLRELSDVVALSDRQTLTDLLRAA